MKEQRVRTKSLTDTLTVYLHSSGQIIEYYDQIIEYFLQQDNEPKHTWSPGPKPIYTVYNISVSYIFISLVSLPHSAGQTII